MLANKGRLVCRLFPGQQRNMGSGGVHTADIVISGGGMVGAACALALANLPVNSNNKIVLLEASSKRDIDMGKDYSNRVVALNNSSVKMLKRLCAWPTIEKHRYNAVCSMRVWDSCSDAAITFQNDDRDTPQSYIIENDLVQKSLNEQMENRDNIKVIHNAKVESYNFPEAINNDDNTSSSNKVEINLANGEKLETQLLVGADGFKSLVRQQLKIDSMSWDYDYFGVVATLTLEHELQSNQTAYQRFLPTGPIAILPLNTKQSSLVWSMPTKLAKEKIKLDEKDFIDEINSELRTTAHQNEIVNNISKGLNLILQSIKSNKESEESIKKLPPLIVGAKNRAAFPLGFTHSNRYVGTNTVLIGDAAHRVHPLAGQGVNLGFGDVECLADVVERCLLDGATLAHRSYLLEYETERQRHNVPTMFSIDSMHRLYTTTLTPVVLARSLGLQITDSIAPMKKVIMSHASG